MGRMTDISSFVSASQVAVALVPPRVEATVGDGVLHRAVGLVCVRTVWKATTTHIWPDISIVASYFLRHDVPKLKLANARRIDNEAADPQRNQSGHGRRVLPFLVLATHFTNA